MTPQLLETVPVKLCELILKLRWLWIQEKVVTAIVS